MTSPAVAQDQPGPAYLIFGAAMSAGSGAIAASLFTPVGALGGALFGATSFLSGRLVNFICDKVNCFPESTIAKVAKFALSTLAGAAIGALITTAIGIPLTLSAAVILTLGIYAVTATAFLVMGGCMCSSAVATGIALGREESGVTVRV